MKKLLTVVSILQTVAFIISGICFAYDAPYSCRFNDDDQAYLSKNLVAGNQKKWTFSTWVKRGNLGTEQIIFGTYNSPSTNDSLIRFNDDDRLSAYCEDGTKGYKKTMRTFTDASSWYHIVVAYDSEGPSMKIYVNGAEETSFEINNDPGLNDDGIISGPYPHGIGYHPRLGRHFDGLITEVHFVDGQALPPDAFGGTINGNWVPKEYNGPYGTNGFYLQFNNASDPGFDSSGNGNNWTAYNLQSTDQLLDSPTNNFSVLNSAYILSNVLLSEGNLKYAKSASSHQNALGTFVFGGGNKWYYEVKATGGVHPIFPRIGLTEQTSGNNSPTVEPFWVRFSGTWYFNGGAQSGSVSSLSNGDILMVAYDADTGKTWVGVNGIWWNDGNPSNGTNELGTILNNENLVSWFHCYYTDNVVEVNFGQDPANGNGYADQNGQGNFAYPPPTGFLALCSKNIEGIIGPPPPAVDITSGATEVGQGETVTLSWTSENADSCEINQGIGSINCNSTMDVTVYETTTYTITAEDTSSGMNASDSVTVFVSGGGPITTPTVTITAEPADEIPPGETVTLSWTSENADSCSIDQGIGSVDCNSSTVVTVYETTIYTITAENTSTGETATDSVTVFVSGGGSVSNHIEGNFTVNGNVGIKTMNPQSELAVNGTVTAKEVIVTDTGWPDFIFDEDYDLPSLEKVEDFIKANKHLPDIPPEKEIREKGLPVSEILSKQMQKIEENTLYIIKLNRRLQEENMALKKEIQAIRKEIYMSPSTEYRSK